MEDKGREKNGMEENWKQLTRELCVTRIFCMISSVLTVVLLVGGVMLFGQLKPVFVWMEQTQPVLEELTQLDIDGVNLTLEQINSTLGNVDWQQVSDAVGSVDWKQISDAVGSVDWHKLSDSLSKLDVDALNKAIEGLDTKELSEAIENLNNTIDVLKGFGEKISSFTGVFGG
uniref:hypothetical protein n=1 Tax=Acetatifactor sp. TaxID=1872090 RepID=UPI0040578A5C